MISRLSTAAALFAVFATAATLALATERPASARMTATTVAMTTRVSASTDVFVMPRVEVIGRYAR